LRSIDLKPDDEILVLDRGYRACLNVLAHVCKRTGAKAVAATLPWPTSGPDEVVASIMRRVTGNTRLAMIDHINSDTGLVLPIAQIVERLNDAGIDVLVDGAHTLGQVEIDISSLSAAYFVSNCHKWLCGPKAAAVLYVRPDRQQGIEPVIISHGSRVDASGKYGSIQDRFAWQGTFDPTPAICAGTASAFLSTLMPGGLKELMQRNHAMAVAWRGLCCERWSINAPCPDEMIGAMAALPICPGFHDDDRCSEAERFRKFIKRLRSEDRIECQPRCFGDPPTLHIRLSCHAYNRGSQVQSVMECMSSWAKEKGR
jgi:isopenicillin-N epimerase